MSPKRGGLGTGSNTAAGLPAISTRVQVALIERPYAKRQKGPPAATGGPSKMTQTPEGFRLIAALVGELLADGVLTGLVALADVFELERLLPDVDGLGLLAQGLVDIAEVIEDFDVLALVALGRLQQILLGFGVVLFLEEDPAKTVEVGGVVAGLVVLQQALLLELLSVR